MSAVEDYREVAARIKADSVYDEHRGMGMMCSPIAHECQEKADAAITELEAEVERLKLREDCDFWAIRAKEAEAALEIERERPCATCGDVNRAEEGGE